MTDQDPKPTVDADDIVAPDRPEPQDTVGSEGGASLVGTPRRVDTDADPHQRAPDDDADDPRTKPISSDRS